MLFNNLLRRFSSRGRKTINVSSSLASRNSEQGKSMTRGEEFLQMIARMQQVLDVEMTQRKEHPGTWINDERSSAEILTRVMDFPCSEFLLPDSNKS